MPWPRQVPSRFAPTAGRALRLTVVADQVGLPACTAPTVAIAQVRQMIMQTVDAAGSSMTTNVSVKESFVPASRANSCPGGKSPILPSVRRNWERG
jgi:hypothetical protein